MKIFRKIVKWALLAMLVLTLLMFVLWVLNAPKELDPASDSKARLDQAAYAIEKMELEFTDPSRPTPALGEFEGDDKRVLEGSVWLPKGRSSGHPLIIYSHGFGGRNNESRHIAEYLASNGYVVAAVDFPLSNMMSPAEVPQLLDVVNQPGDVSATLDQVLSLNNDPKSELYQRIDENSIGALGLSLGGLTTALVTFHPDLKDPRIKAAVMMAPPLEAFSELFYGNNTEVKSLLLSGSMDRVVPELANATEVKKRQPNGWFISLDKGTHLGFANLGNPIRWMENPDDLGCAFMDRALSKLELPERWDAVIPNTGGALRDIDVGLPCPDLPGKSMNGLKQQWLTRIATGAFFDMHLRSGRRAESAHKFFTEKLISENPEVRLTSPL
jgi:dienelactone hydrolase